MEKKLLEAYVDGFKMANEMFGKSTTLFGFARLTHPIEMNARHVAKMAEYASIDIDSRNMPNEVHVTQFNNWLSDSKIETRSDEFRCVFKITHGSSVVTGSDFLEMYDIFKSVHQDFIPR